MSDLRKASNTKCIIRFLLLDLLLRFAVLIGGQVCRGTKVKLALGFTSVDNENLSRGSWVIRLPGSCSPVWVTCHCNSCNLASKEGDWSDQYLDYGQMKLCCCSLPAFQEKSLQHKDLHVYSVHFHSLMTT